MEKPLRTRSVGLVLSSLLSAGLFLASGCSAPQVNTFPSLANQGQLALSTTNPYLGSNLFLSQEMERSTYLYNFMKGRGAPTAMELLEKGDSPSRILLYYPKDKEVYAADLMIVGKDINSRQWVTRGPYQIDRKDFKNLLRMENSMVGEPVFVLRGKEHRFRFQHDEPSDRVIAALPPPIPTPKPAPKPKKKVIYQSNGEGGVSEINPRDFRPLNSDQQAIQMAKGFAERTSNGDVVHTVRSSDETLELISRWYSGGPNNAASLAQANAIPVGTALNPGARITIPLRMIKEFKQMPEGYK
ncbi:MAG: hypothetical protein K1X83_01780 [Oligoflexia bacterium]|nr:hypothetical protein [Oligoflexia bacterium]